MKMKTMFVLLCVASMSTGAFAMTFMGPPTAGLEQGKFQAGYVFSYGKMDIDGEDDEGDYNYTLKDFEMTSHYFDLGYGMADNLEFNVLLGMASGDLDEVEGDEGTEKVDFCGDNQFSFGFNAKYTFIDDEKIDWGAMFQMTSFSTEDEDVEIEAYDYLIGVGPTVDMGGWNLYGGAYFYMLDGEAGPDNDCIEEADSFGGYVGAGFEIMENTNLAIEGAFSSDTMGIGLSVLFGF